MRGGGAGAGGCFKYSHPQLPPLGDGVEVLSPLSCRKIHFPPKTSVQVPGQVPETRAMVSSVGWFS